LLLAIDAGNSNVKFAVFDGDKLVGQWRLSTNTARTDKQYFTLLRDLIQLGANLEAIVVASVVPSLNATLAHFAEEYFKLTPVFVNHATNTGVRIRYDSPADLGADRIVDAVAAIEKYGAPCIVVDFGTATTFNAINAAGEFIGGAISPGMMTCSEALIARTAKLPRDAFVRPEKVIGSSTVSAIQSGLYHGYAGLVDGVLERMIEEMGATPRVIATGGLASAVAAASRFIQEVDDTLTLEGLRLVYERTKT
jgi:type III pantothenate kinase